ncbi:hypothetical protein [Rhodopila sp.]|uniref:hypothetical protein n=1 Tax=Rhodopila sp. TaxID=2480087 RepID=UPI003D0BE292
MDTLTAGYSPVIEEICAYDWATLSPDQLSLVAWAYYYFSIQFRENLEVTLALLPDDPQLQKLKAEECDTANLSPWPGVAAPGEAMNHDEFMARALRLSPINAAARHRVERAGELYLKQVRATDEMSKAMSIASYEGGGLEAIFHAFLRARDWNTPLLHAFRHFLTKHIQFDSNPDAGHGALCAHLVPDDRIRGLWVAFRTLLIEAVPHLTLAA